MLTAFSWGYDGWGNSIRELLDYVDRVESARGYERPLFVDVRARRTVRAEGFRGDAFERSVKPSNYRWMRGLGNEAILTGRGPVRLIEPGDVNELLETILAQARLQPPRHVIFFCSCRSPSLPGPGKCHRFLVASRLKAAAKKRGIPLRTEEWPGGKPSRRAIHLSVRPDVMDQILANAATVRLGRTLNQDELLGLPHGSSVRFEDGSRKRVVRVDSPVFKAGRWQLPIHKT